MKVVIHQPEHLPWCGLLARIATADLWVILDSVQYRRRYFQNRNQILGSEGLPLMLTVPVKDDGRDVKIQDVRIDNSTPWWERHWKTLEHNYGRHLWWDIYEPELRPIYCAQWGSLAALNVTLAVTLLDFFQVKRRTVLSSTLNVAGAKSDLMLGLARKVGATEYLAGPFEMQYLDHAALAAAGIRVKPFHYATTPYEQRRPEGTPFVADLSSIDLLMNRGVLAKSELLAGVR